MRLLLIILFLYLGVQDTTKVKKDSVKTRGIAKRIDSKLDSALIKLQKLRLKKDTTKIKRK